MSKAQTNLGYATIYAPIDGVVLSKSVEEGQTVASSFSTPTLFVIAEDLTQMRVIANVDEADIGGVNVGQRVSFTVDAYPGESFAGEVVQVRQEATTTGNVVTYEVVINAPNNELKLKPGLTASVTIYTEEHNSVLLIPGKALHFTPVKGAENIISDKCPQAKNKVWTHEDNKFVSHEVTTGMSTGSQTEILSGLTEGMRIIIGVSVSNQYVPAGNGEGQSGERSPFMPGHKGNKQK